MRWPGGRAGDSVAPDGHLFIVAADHTARAMIGVSGQPRAMIDRRVMLDRLLVALANPRVDGVLASADILEDLVLLGALDDRVVVGTMNRGGLAGASWELDDRFTAYDADHLIAARFDAGKMLLRIDGSDPGTVPTLAACADAVKALNDRRMLAMVEPIPYTKDASGKAVWDDDPDALLKAVGVCAALGHSSAYTWLKIQATANVDEVAAMTTQPLLILGGAPGPDPDASFASWERALTMPSVRGLVVGRALLYPGDGDVEAAVGAGRGHRAARRAGTRSGGVMSSHPWHLGAVRTVTPEQVGWTYCGLRIAELAPGESVEGATGNEELAVLPVAGGAVAVDVEGHHFELAGRTSVFDRVTDWCYLPIDAEVRIASTVGATVALPSARAQVHFDPAYVAAARRGRRGARRRPRHTPGDQLHGAGGVRWRRPVDVRRGAHARRQLVELPAAQARRQPGVPREQRGDLLLPRRPHRGHRLRPRGLRDAPHVHPARRRRRRNARHWQHGAGPGGDRRQRPRRRRVRDPPRLPRAERGGAGLPAVLPERARRARRRAIDGVLRRPHPPLDPRELGHDGRSIPAAR